MKKIRRNDRAIQVAEAQRILASGEYGILSTVGEDGQPYGVPLSYVYKNDAVYFHSAPAGHKIDNLQSNPKVSFCVIANTKVLPAEFSTEYKCAMAFGLASEVKGDEWHEALMWLVEKYAPAYIEEGPKKIAQLAKVTKVFKIEIRHISGKARR